MPLVANDDAALVMPLLMPLYALLTFETTPITPVAPLPAAPVPAPAKLLTTLTIVRSSSCRFRQRRPV